MKKKHVVVFRHAIHNFNIIIYHKNNLSCFLIIFSENIFKKVIENENLKIWENELKMTNLYRVSVAENNVILNVIYLIHNYFLIFFDGDNYYNWEYIMFKTSSSFNQNLNLIYQKIVLFWYVDGEKIINQFKMRQAYDFEIRIVN